MARSPYCHRVRLGPHSRKGKCPTMTSPITTTDTSAGRIRVDAAYRCAEDLASLGLAIARDILPPPLSIDPGRPDHGEPLTVQVRAADASRWLASLDDREGSSLALRPGMTGKIDGTRTTLRVVWVAS